MIALAAAAAAGCRRASPPPSADPPSDAQVYPVARPAIRCAECHGKMHTEWAASAHARSEISPLYRAMRHDSGDAAACDRCHAPLVGVVEPGEAVVHEGVTCEVCHTIDAVTERPSGGGFTMALRENIQRGPICDARDHYFHKMGCSPLHAESRFCAACHNLVHGGLEVLTDVVEWRSSDYADLLDCQDCHMPESTAEVAEGSPPRTGVSHHGYLGNAAIFRRALAGKLAAAVAGDKLEIEVLVRNVGAGHQVPGGIPGRQLIVRVRALDAGGATLAQGERIYQRLLVDRLGRVVPFYRAEREASDNRLGPREQRLERFTLGAAAAHRVRLEILRRDLAPEIVGAVGQPPFDEVMIVSAEVPPGGATDWQQ